MLPPPFRQGASGFTPAAHPASTSLMARPSRPPRPFFDDKNRAFWLLQSAGWMGYFLLRSLGGVANNMGLLFIVPTALATATGYSLTLLMGAAFRRLITAKPFWTWSMSILLLMASSAAFSTIEVWAHATFYRPGTRPEGVQFIGAIL